MRDYVERIKPILIELDGVRSVHQPVLVEDHLVPLFAKHSPFKDIRLYAMEHGPIMGMHLSDASTGIAHIFYRKCIAHFGSVIVGSCPSCQMARLTVAKELVHILDSDGARTSIADAPEMLIEILLKGSLSANAHVQADTMALLWAIEMLARYQHRIIQTGNGSIQPSAALRNARETGDWGLFAAGYAIPHDVARVAYSENFMSIVKGIREKAGLPIVCVG